MFAAALAACLLAPATSHAADATVDAGSADTGWTFTAAPYLWAAGIDGTVGLFGLPPVQVDASFSDVMKNFDIGFMGAGEAHYGRFGLAVDIQYIRVSAEAAPPLGLAADRVDVTSTTFSAFAGAMYRMVDDPQVTVDAMAGARLWSVDNDLDPVGGPLGPADFSDGSTWVDPMVGAKARINLSDQFYVTGWALVGGSGSGSNLTWDAMGALGYEASDTVSLIAGYRALSVDYTDGSFVFDVVEQGPILGAVFKF